MFFHDGFRYLTKNARVETRICEFDSHERKTSTGGANDFTGWVGWLFDEAISANRAIVVEAFGSIAGDCHGPIRGVLLLVLSDTQVVKHPLVLTE